MKVYINEDQVWPVYSIDTDVSRHTWIVEIPDELYERYLAAGEEYEKVQEELAKYS